MKKVTSCSCLEKENSLAGTIRVVTNSKHKLPDKAVLIGMNKQYSH